MIDRVHGRAAFQRFAREGTRVRSGVLWCSMVPDPTVPTAHVAFSVGRSVGPAVVRNRLRRRLRAILRQRDLEPGLYLIGASPAAPGLTFAQLGAAVDDLLARLASKRAQSVRTT